MDMGKLREFVVIEDDGEMTVMGTDGQVRAFSPFLERWLEGWPRRGEILGCVRSLLEPCPGGRPVEGFDRAAGPAVLLLRRGMTGIKLGPGGAFPAGLRGELESLEPTWASDQSQATIDRLYRVLARGSLMRRKGRRIRTTASGRDLRADPDVLVRMSACWLVPGEGFNTDVAELGAALLLDGADLDVDELTDRAYPAIAEYWTALGEPVGREQVARSMSRWLALASAVGAIPDPWAEDLRTPGSRWPRPVGEVARASLTAMLRYRTVRHIPRRPFAQIA